MPRSIAHQQEREKKKEKRKTAMWGSVPSRRNEALKTPSSALRSSSTPQHSAAVPQPDAQVPQPQAPLPARVASSLLQFTSLSISNPNPSPKREGSRGGDRQKRGSLVTVPTLGPDRTEEHPLEERNNIIGSVAESASQQGVPLDGRCSATNLDEQRPAQQPRPSQSSAQLIDLMSVSAVVSSHAASIYAPPTRNEDGDTPSASYSGKHAVSFNMDQSFGTPSSFSPSAVAALRQQQFSRNSAAECRPCAFDSATGVVEGSFINGSSLPIGSSSVESDLSFVVAPTAALSAPSLRAVRCPQPPPPGGVPPLKKKRSGPAPPKLILKDIATLRQEHQKKNETLREANRLRKQQQLEASRSSTSLSNTIGLPTPPKKGEENNDTSPPFIRSEFTAPTVHSNKYGAELDDDKETEEDSQRTVGHTNNDSISTAVPPPPYGNREMSDASPRHTKGTSDAPSPLGSAESFITLTATASSRSVTMIVPTESGRSSRHSTAAGATLADASLLAFPRARTESTASTQASRKRPASMEGGEESERDSMLPKHISFTREGEGSWSSGAATGFSQQHANFVAFIQNLSPPVVVELMPVSVQSSMQNTMKPEEDPLLGEGNSQEDDTVAVTATTPTTTGESGTRTVASNEKKCEDLSETLRSVLSMMCRPDR